MTCKDCIHYFVCHRIINGIPITWADKCGDFMAEQEPCDDVVSRQAYLLDWLCRLRSEINCGMDMASVPEKHRNKMISVLTDVIKQLSSVQPKPIECDDAISRQAVIDRLSHWYSDMLETGKEKEDLIEVIKAIPSVRPQEQTGKWILKRTFPTKLYDEYLNEYKCSECYREIRCTESQLVNYPYCHCGAKMVEPQERNDKE